MNYEVIETDKNYAKIHYPELWKNTEIEDVNNIEKAYDIFKSLPPDELPKDFDESFMGGDGWCDIYDTSEGRIAVYSQGSLSSSYPLYIIKLDNVNENKKMKKVNYKVKKLAEQLKKLSNSELKSLYEALSSIQSKEYNEIVDSFWKFWDGKDVGNYIRYGDTFYHETLVYNPETKEWSIVLYSQNEYDRNLKQVFQFPNGQDYANSDTDSWDEDLTFEEMRDAVNDFAEEFVIYHE